MALPDDHPLFTLDAVRRRNARRWHDALSPLGSLPAGNPCSSSTAGKDDAQPMTRQADGWFELVTDKAPAGTRYQYPVARRSGGARPRVPLPARGRERPEPRGRSEKLRVAEHATGAAAPGKRPSCTNSTSAASPTRAPMTASAASWTIWPISASPRSSSCRWPTSRAAGDGVMTAFCPMPPTMPTAPRTT